MGSRRGGRHEGDVFVWVLVPTLATDDPNLQCYYDFSRSRDEYARAFAELGVAWKWQPVTMRDYREVIETIAASAKRRPTIVFNLCDGDEINGAPGISVLHQLEAAGLVYTGSDATFYDATTSKIAMKEAFDRAGVPTAPWEVVSPGGLGAEGVFDRLGAPLILKPAVSAASLGLSTRSVVADFGALRDQIAVLESGYHGWNLAEGGMFVEQFVAGREYTTFIVGSHAAPQARTVYPPVELVFHRSLPPSERFISFDRGWEFFQEESPVGQGGRPWSFASPSEAQDARLREVCWAAYSAVGGTGYGRVDVREDERTGRLYVLEVNAQCGLSETDVETSIGAIRELAGLSYAKVIRRILDEALAAAAMRAAVGG